MATVNTSAVIYSAYRASRTARYAGICGFINGINNALRVVFFGGFGLFFNVFLIYRVCARFEKLDLVIYLDEIWQRVVLNCRLWWSGADNYPLKFY